MGRKTHESIGKSLPGRLNIVISKHNSSIPGCLTVDSPEKALNLVPNDQIAFVIGGAEIYRQYLPICQCLYVTFVHGQFDGDIYFPKIDWSEWQEINRQDFKASKDNPCNYSFVTFQRKSLLTRN